MFGVGCSSWMLTSKSLIAVGWMLLEARLFFCWLAVAARPRL
jgi:hypothetical protein